MIHLSSDTGETFVQAFHFAQRQVKRLVEKHPGVYPVYTEDGKWVHAGEVPSRWCDGFLPGMMWIFAESLDPDSSDARYWTEQAIKYTAPLEARKSDRNGHDLGFLFLSTYYRWHRMTKEAAKRDVLIEAGRTMATRFRDRGGYIRSSVAENSLMLDTMMNVGLVFYAARETNDRRLWEIAVRHSLTTRRVLVRGDGSTAQEGVFESDTGEFLRHETHQGYRRDSCWSRGLAWALYGFAMAYEHSRDPHFIETAQACADFYITHCGPEGIPPWDFNAPPENRTLVDTSAAAICASGLMRLARIVPDSLKGHLYRSTAIRILKSLCDQYLAKNDHECEGILRGGVYHVHKSLGVDESVMWGEYFFCEALQRALR